MGGKRRGQWEKSLVRRSEGVRSEIRVSIEPEENHAKDDMNITEMQMIIRNESICHI